MKRRTFIQQSGMFGAAMAAMPAHLWQDDDDYSVARLMGKEEIPLMGKDINLIKGAYEAFVEMKKAAYSDGIDLKIASSYRSFYHQQAIWERKYLQYTEEEGMEPLPAIEKIIEYSTIPGTSRHHWGTDIDIIDGYQKTDGDVLVAEKFEEGGPFANLKQWMEEHANHYGFYIVYTKNPKRRGFKYEPWHYSYAPISIPMLKAYRRLNLMRILPKEDILGAEHFTTGFIRTYIQDNILNINPNLL